MTPSDINNRNRRTLSARAPMYPNTCCVSVWVCGCGWVYSQKTPRKKECLFLKKKMVCVCFLTREEKSSKRKDHKEYIEDSGENAVSRESQKREYRQIDREQIKRKNRQQTADRERHAQTHINTHTRINTHTYT